MRRLDYEGAAAELNRIARLKPTLDPTSSEYHDLEVAEGVLRWVADPRSNPRPIQLLKHGYLEAIDQAPNLRAGDRVELSEWGAASDPVLAHRQVEGTVVRISKKFGWPVVRWDDRKSAVVVSVTYLRKVTHGL